MGEDFDIQEHFLMSSSGCTGYFHFHVGKKRKGHRLTTGFLLILLRIPGKSHPYIKHFQPSTCYLRVTRYLKNYCYCYSYSGSYSIVWIRRRGIIIVIVR